MDIYSFLQTRRGKFTAIGVFAAIFIAIPLLFYVFSLGPGGIPTQKYTVKKLPLTYPIGVDSNKDKVYLENGRRFISYQAGKVAHLSGEMILPEIDELYITKDEKRALFRSVGYFSDDVTEPIRTFLKLDAETAYWWSIDLKTGELTLVTHKNTPVRIANSHFNRENGQLEALSVVVTGDTSTQYIYTINNEGVVTDAVAMPIVLDTFVRNDKTIYGLTSQKEIALLTEQGDKAKVTKTLLKNVYQANFAPNASWAYIVQEENNTENAWLFDLINNKKVLNTGEPDEVYSIWGTDVAELYLTQTLIQQKEQIGIARITPTAESKQVTLLGKVAQEQPVINGILTANSEVVVAMDGNSHVYIVTKNPNTLPNAYQELNDVTDDNVSLLFRATDNYVVASQLGYTLTPEQVRTKTYELLRKNGFNPDLTKVQFIFQQQLNRIEE